MERNIVMICQIIMAHIAKFQYIATSMVGFHRWLQNIGTEKRPEGMPVYQVEQMKIGEHYFYSLKHFNDGLKKIPLFSIKKELTSAGASSATAYVLDVISVN